MTTLAYLNEPGVLFNLRSRYVLDAIYTYTGAQPVPGCMCAADALGTQLRRYPAMFGQLLLQTVNATLGRESTDDF